MSKVIECKGCLDCPFRYDDYHPDSMGKDTIVCCTLAEHLKLPLYLIASYDTWEIEDEGTFSIDTPMWCPLKNEGEVTIKIN